MLAPELGLPLLLFGLRLLALEFDWAVRLYVRVEKLGRRLFGQLKRPYESMFESKRRIAVTVLIWAVVTVAAGLVSTKLRTEEDLDRVWRRNAEANAGGPSARP